MCRPMAIHVSAHGQFEVFRAGIDCTHNYIDQSLEVNKAFWFFCVNERYCVCFGPGPPFSCCRAADSDLTGPCRLFSVTEKV